MLKKCLLLTVSGLSLLACQKTDEENDVAPAAVVAAFNAEFSLHYQQAARLPAATQPELTVEVTDLDYFFCPKDVLCCFVTSFVAPTLSVTDAQGRVQQVKLTANASREYTPAWIDTTSVKANGQRYVLYYTKWNTGSRREQAGKKDVSVTLRVTKAAAN
ncbi:hypothetical protein GCM10022408_20300 [Hymenobacter fastidiosus]|uniref:Lipoprotein n=1 Tax=Hymenobacter fastidiosus TaxID=486264 RepID=A0ABP7S8A8_9BACT